MTGFDLDEVIREEFEKSISPDPRSIASAVSKRTPDGELRGAYEWVLPQYIIPIESSYKRLSGGAMTGAKSNKTPPRRSAKWENARRVALLARDDPELARWSIYGVGGKSWLNDSTGADLMHAIDHHFKLADSNQAEAKKLQRLLAEMEARKAKTVGDLPADVVRGCLS
jgi:hypothetical protein